jgi:hypothetical protein
MDLHWFGSLAPDPHSDKKLDPDPHRNQCGSTTKKNFFKKSKRIRLEKKSKRGRTILESTYQDEYSILSVQCYKIKLKQD